MSLIIQAQIQAKLLIPFTIFGVIPRPDFHGNQIDIKNI